MLLYRAFNAIIGISAVISVIISSCLSKYRFKNFKNFEYIDTQIMLNMLLEYQYVHCTVLFRAPTGNIMFSPPIKFIDKLRDAV